VALYFHSPIRLRGIVLSEAHGQTYLRLSQVVFSLHIFRIKFYVHFARVPRMLHAPRVLSSLTDHSFYYYSHLYTIIHINITEALSRIHYTNYSI
jgi:hypothetical protein